MMSRLQESERILDAALECSFPASDPIAVHNAFQAACEREGSGRTVSAAHDEVRTQAVLRLVNDLLDPQAVHAVGQCAVDDVRG